MRPAPPEDRQKIIDLYKNGMTRPAIARETGWSEGTVHNIIKASGIVGAGRVTGVRTDPETEALVVSMYEQGATWREIMERTDRTEHTVQAILKRLGKDLDRKHSLTDADWKQIVKLYDGGMDAPDIANRFNCHSSMVYYVLENSGRQRRPRGCENTDYFDSIDTPEKAYWLGFIGADGCVTGFASDNPRLVIKLARKDREHLATLHRALGASRPVRDFEDMSLGVRRPYSALTVYSPHLVEALGRAGITARKTNALEPWAGAPELMPHYWRGLIDGDGSITINDRGVYVGFTGSEACVRGFLAWANDVCGTKSNARQGNGGKSRYWITQVGGAGDRRSGVTRLIRALYDDAPVALARKKALADLAVHGKPLQATLL
jgi:transposase